MNTKEILMLVCFKMLTKTGNIPPHNYLLSCFIYKYKPFKLRDLPTIMAVWRLTASQVSKSESWIVYKKKSMIKPTHNIKMCLKNPTEI